MDMLSKWNYQGLSDVCYGGDDALTYQKAAAFLGDTCEDWGCGMGWAARYFSNYHGVDGSLGYVSEPTDLVGYTSKVDNILLRWVLEHNLDWRQILANAKQSFTKKLCLVIFTPLAEETHLMFMNPGDIPEISFRKQDILAFFDDCQVTEETLPTTSPYGSEWMLYVSK